ncbi:hypothetical protein [Microbacterium sp. MMO-10]|uniref:hypothetical protein n=2 Tax=unclassified Microbacterium TaxID=2609290 RepID=UPI003019F14D
MSEILLSRADIIDALTELVSELRADGRRSHIQIVGGAAIALTLNADRRATRDVDAPATPAEAVIAASARVAQARGWPDDWFNNAAEQFVPAGFGRAAEWRTVHDDGVVRIDVASPEMLLAMKLHAAQRRHLREADDLSVLLRRLEVRSVTEAEETYGEFYPGDEFSPRLFALVGALLDVPGDAPPLPDPPRFA